MPFWFALNSFDVLIFLLFLTFQSKRSTNIESSWPSSFNIEIVLNPFEIFLGKTAKRWDWRIVVFLNSGTALLSQNKENKLGSANPFNSKSRINFRCCCTVADVIVE